MRAGVNPLSLPIGLSFVAQRAKNGSLRHLPRPVSVCSVYSVVTFSGFSKNASPAKPGTPKPQHTIFVYKTPSFSNSDPILLP
jgi:hypothetical protein